MNTQIVFLKRTNRVLYTEGQTVYYELDADVTPADYVRDSAQKACFAVYSGPEAMADHVDVTYPVNIRRNLDGSVGIGIAGNISGNIYANIFVNTTDPHDMALNNKWVVEVEHA